ncbi:MAG TPA: hypothetical protein VE690_16295 [Rhodopila sp.]|nr:hypothetical protein [Rhodopila sp.]
MESQVATWTLGYTGNAPHPPLVNPALVNPALVNIDVIGTAARHDHQIDLMSKYPALAPRRAG